MKKEIFDWYEERCLPVHRQIILGQKFGLSKFHVEAAMEYCYNRIANEGKKIPDCQIAWYIRNVAKNIDITGIEEEHRLIENSKAVVDEVKEKLEDVKVKLVDMSGQLLEERNKSTALKKKHLDEINDLSVSLSENKELAENIRNITNVKIIELNKDYETAIINLTNKHDADIVSLKTKHDKLTSKHGAEIEKNASKLKDGFNQELESEIRRGKESVEKIEKHHEFELQKIREAYEDKLRVELGLLEKSHVDKFREADDIHKSELQELHDDNKLKLRETTESYVNIINKKNDELRKNKSSHEAELGRYRASREAQRKRFEGDLSKEIAVTKFMSASIFKLKDQLESERKKARRISTFYYIFTILSLIQAGLWLL